nr:putative ribonuclease H-like domain-containing protein [Tanacetum cinerariifolium]
PQPVPTSKPKVSTPVPTGKPKVSAPVSTGKPKVSTLVPTGKPKVSTPAPTSKPKVSTPVPAGRPNRPFSVPTDRGYSPSDEGIFDSGCSRSMTGNKERLDDFQAFQGGKVTFRGGEGRITRKRIIRTPTLNFENVYYVKELQQFNLFSIFQICDKKNQVLFTDTECLVLSKDFKLPDDSMVVLRVPRKHNLYTINLNKLCPRGNLACLVAHASFDKFVKWHRRMGHVNYKNMNILVKGNLDRGLPSKLFKNDHTCVAFCKGKQHKASYKAIHVVSSISEPLVSVTSPHNKTPYALLIGHIPSVSHFKPFRCHVTILNTSDHLGKFDGKANEGYIVGYSASNKACRVYNVPNKRVDESMTLRFLEEKPNVQGLGYEWYFDLDYLTDSLGYKHVQANQFAGTQGATTNSAGTQAADSASDCDEQTQTSAKTVPPGYIPVPTGTVPVPPGSLPIPAGSIPVPADATIVSTDDVSVHTSHSTDSIFDDEPTTRFFCPSDLGNHAPSPGIFSSSSYDDEFGAALNNVASTVEVSPVATKRINTIHPQSLIIRDPTLAVQTRIKVKQTSTGDSAFISYIFDQQRDNHTDFQHCLFECFISQVEPRSIAQALEDPSWVDAMQEEMQHFKFQNVWILVDLLAGKYAIGTKWILKNKRDARGIVVRNKARLVAQGHRQEEGIDYDEVFAYVSRIEAIRLFLAFASYMGFLVYQMDVKSAFLYGKINEEVYVTKPKGFVDPQHPKKVYKVVKALYGLHQAPRAWYATLSTFLQKHGYRRGTIDKTLFLKKNNKDIILVQVYVDDIIFRSTKKAWCDEFEALIKGEFQMSAMGELTFFLGLQVQQRPDGIFINQEKYVQEILTKFDLGSVRAASTPYEAPKPKSKNESDSPINVHLYRSIIGSLMYLTASRPDIMFAVSACSRHQVTHTTSNLEAEKKIFKYLKGQPKLGLWYPKESPLMLEAYSDSDYAGANKDRKSTTGGSEYVAAANCCGQVLWIQNQLLDYGHHFIRDANEKKLIQVLKIHTNDNVADLLTKAFDEPSFTFFSTGPFFVPSAFYWFKTMDYCFLSALNGPVEIGIFNLLKLNYLYLPTLHFDHQPTQNLNPISTSSMAALRYKDKHNKVGYLLKPTRSDDYHQIIDFLRASHIRAPELGPPTIIATIDKTPYTITEDLVRSRLQLADDGGIADLPIAEIYSEMDNLGNIGNAKKLLMYPRFIQTILGIETRVTRQYKVLVFSSKLFANMRLNFAGHLMPLLPTMLLQAQAGEGTEVAAQAVPQPVPAPDQPPASLSTHSRQQTSDPIAPVLEHGQNSDPHTASFSRSRETDAGPFKTGEDAPMGGDFHTSPPRFSQAPPAGQPSGGTEDPITLTALSSIVSTLVQKVHSLEYELKYHKTLFKDVVGKLVKKVKALEIKLKTKKRKMVVTVTVDSNIPSGGTSHIPAASPSVSTVVPTGTSAIPTGASTVPAGSLNVPTGIPSSAAPASVSSKGKSLMVEEDIPVKARTFKQIEEDRLGEDAAKRLHDEEMAQMERQRAEVQRKRQQAILDSTMYYNEADWLNIRAQVEANASLSKTLMDLDADAQTFIKVVVNEDSDDENSDDEVWSAVVGWEDLVKLYGLVVQYYENHPVAGAGL